MAWAVCSLSFRLQVLPTVPARISRGLYEVFTPGLNRRIDASLVSNFLATLMKGLTIDIKVITIPTRGEIHDS